MTRALVVLIVGIAAASCAGDAHAARRPSTTRATTGGQSHVVRMSDAVPTERFTSGGAELDLNQRIRFAGRELLFGQADAYDENDKVVATLPLIAEVRPGGGRHAISIADARLANAEWQFIAKGPRRGEGWGALDNTLDGHGKVVLLVHTTDAGATWNVTTIDKPFGEGQYDSFAMSADGHGRLTMYVPPAKRHPKRAGFYHFRTTDGGQTWSPPEHERDELTPADEVEGTDDEPSATPPGQRV